MLRPLVLTCIVFLIPTVTLASEVYVGAGLSQNFEVDSESNYQSQFVPELSLGFSSGEFIFLLEAGRFDLQSGNEALSVGRKVEDLKLSTIWNADRWSLIAPYVVASAGVRRETVDTVLLANTNRTSSPWGLFGEIGFGARLLPWTSVWFSPEVKLGFGEQIKPDPQPSANLRFGYLF
jgi:hypothetical protein